MLEHKLLTINLKQEDNSLKIIPCMPLLSSHKAGWNGIYLKYYRGPAWETPEFCVAQHGIIIHTLVHPDMKVERMLDGCWKNEQPQDGDIVVTPANVLTRSSWTIGGEFISLALEPNFLANVAYELINPHRVELVPQFAKPEPVIYQIGLALKAALAADELGSRFYAESAATFLAAHLLQHYSSQKSIFPNYTGGLPKHKLKQAIDYMQAHLAEEVSLAAIASYLNMSRYYFCRLFKRATGITPYQYLIQLRVERAKELLLQRQQSVTNIALTVGFANQGHFSHHFKRLTGVTPKQFLN